MRGTPAEVTRALIARSTEDTFFETTVLAAPFVAGIPTINKSMPDGEDDTIVRGYDSLARRLCQVSPYASRIESFIGRIPEIMVRNDQLRPLWTAWRQNATPDMTPRQYFAAGQIKVLCDFLEYLYFASDAFASSARRCW